MLDDLDRVRSLDKRDMLGMIRGLPGHLTAGVKLGSAVRGVNPAPSDIIVCGLGGSAIGGDLVRAWLETEGDLRCEVVRGYSAPRWVGPRTLAIVASYSGNTEETLSLLEDVLLREANVVAIASGGTLADMAEARSVPCVAVPAGMVPRASLGYVLGGMMGILMSAGVADPGEHLEEAVRIMADVSSMCDMAVPTVDNPAKRLAHELHGFVPVVVGHGLSIPVGKRWANQLNENAKSIAFSSQLPEMDHNEIVFWSSDPRSQGFAGVFLDHDVSDARMASRLEATRQMICGRSRAQVVKAIGDSPLAQMLSLVQLGDYVSFYSAVLMGEDPSTTEPIESLKKIIAKK